MDERKCKNCRFWDVDTEIFNGWYDEQVENVGECKCTKIKDISEVGAKNIGIDEAGTTDYDSYKSSFITGPGFGCIHFEKQFNPGDPISFIFAQPGNDTTWGIVTKVTDTKIYVYDPFFSINTEINIDSKSYWPTTDEEVKYEVDGGLVWDILRKARKELGLNPDNNG